jgi:beta-galactosidase
MGNHSIFRSLLFGLLLLSLFDLFAQNKVERSQNINNDWLYLEDNTTSPATALDKTHWLPLSLPHSWNSLDATDVQPGYRRGAGWYRKTLKEDIQTDKRYFLYFEGSNITTHVYVNQKLAGSHIGGYVGFEIEITEHLNANNNELLVYVDNHQNREIIPSSKNDFFIFGGITRDVWLKTVSSVHIKRIKVSTPSVSKKSANAVFDVTLNGTIKDSYQLEVKVTDSKGKLVYNEKKKLKSLHETIKFSELKNPELWDVEVPNLYNVSVRIFDEKELIDQLSEQFGYRWFEIKEHGAFYLNGKRLLLRGTHRHEEHAGYGAAMPNEMHKNDIKMIKEMGANMLRLGHYPQDPEVYKSCDELGIIVWDELPWSRGGVGDSIWKQNTKNLLEEMIVQNYNHPSIMFWSLGNEIYWLPDYNEGGDTTQINIFLNELNDLAHQLDDSRYTALRKYYEGAHIPDVFSSSIWAGWYSGNYQNYEPEIQKAMAKYKRFIHAEYGGSSHLGRHTEIGTNLGEDIQEKNGDEPIIQVGKVNYAQNGDWSENYLVDLMDWHLKVSETTPGFAGNLQWAFKDFGTPLRPENDIPYMNQKGLIDREGSPKDAYYVYKSYWAKEPFTYIESATWTERYGESRESKEISVFSNCSKVELVHDGIKLGKKKKDIHNFPASGLRWNVSFNEGVNQLIAIGYLDEIKVYDTLNITYYTEPPGSPQELELTYKKLPSGSILVTALALDKNGRRATNYEEKVYFQSMAGGELKQSHGTPTGSSIIAMANGKAMIEFTPHPTAEKATIGILNQDFKGTVLEIPLKNILYNQQ